jgi:hypothetical protein
VVEILKKCRARVLQKDNTVVSVGAGGLNKLNRVVPDEHIESVPQTISGQGNRLTEKSRPMLGNYEEISKSLRE